MDCQKLYKDIERLKSLRDELSAKLEESTESGLGKVALSSLSNEVSNSTESLLEEYAYDLTEQNINDKESKNSEFLNSVLKQYLQEQDESEDNSESLITLDTTIDRVRANLAEYLKSDKTLESHLLVYALKEKMGLLNDNPEKLSLKELEELCKDIIPEAIKDKTLPKLAYLHNVAERIKNLEVLETKSYIFMLPKDKWNEGKIKLPNPENNPDTPEHIAPTDLTAILKEPVYYDWNYETDGRNTDNPSLVYDEKWVGKEIRHFPWSKELIREANENLLKPNGYHIPESWEPTVNSLTAELVRERDISPDDIRDSEISTALRERLGLAVWRGDPKRAGEIGSFWSSSERSEVYAYCFHFDFDEVYPESIDNRDCTFSVRCVSESAP